MLERVNGQTAAVDFTTVTRDLKIRMRQDGDDDVEIQGSINLPRDLNAKMGDGQLVVEGTSGGVDVARDLKATADGDVALRNGVVVHGKTTIKAAGAATAAATPGILPDFSASNFSDPTTIDNPNFPLVPGTVYTYEDISADEDTGALDIESDVVTVTNNTRTVDGVTVREVHDQAFRADGKIIEDTIDFHAQDDDGNVWYLGEDTTSFEYDAQGNQISSSTEGSWTAGVNGARPGIIMLAHPQVGDAYFQELAPGVVLDHGRVLATDASATVPVGTFNNVVHTDETSVLEPEDIEQKFYAPGLGSVQEQTFDPRTGAQTGVVRLLSATLNGTPTTQVVSPSGFTGTNATGTTSGTVQLIGKSSVRSTDTLVLAGASFAARSKVTSESDLAIRDTTFVGKTSLRATDTLGLEDNVSITGASDLRSADVFVLGSTFNGASTIRLANSDDELAIQNSTFTSLFANGRSGDDTFDDLGGNTFGSLTKRSFEEP